MSIIIQNISKFYGKQQALTNISFSIKKGEILALLGPNGAGKSTLMKIITGFITQTSGKVNICNIDTLSNSIETKKKIGYLAENNPLYQNMYVREYLNFIGGIYKIENIGKKVKDVISETGLEIEEKKKIQYLSKGFKQRVGLAAALLHNPEILILDEPTTGLDPNQLVEIRNLIKRIGKNKTVILSTHIMQEVDKLCNRIIIINKGNIVDDQHIGKIKKNKIDLEKHFYKLTR